MTSSRDRTRFVADAMLGSLARKLRALGFDTAYYRSGDDLGLIRLASEEGRVLLTSDRSLAALAQRRRVASILVGGRSDSQRISAVAQGALASGLTLLRGEPLCSLCGGALVAATKEELSASVPRAVLLRHRLFLRCASCGQAYWRGSHWKKLRSLAGRLGQTHNASEHG